MRSVLKQRILICSSLLLAACSSPPDRYRDTQHLELPPTLVIEHHGNQPVDADEPLAKALAKPKNSLMALLVFNDDEKNPSLMLKTRLERAWDLVLTAIKVTEAMQLVDQSHDDAKFEVIFDADHVSDDVGFFQELMNNRYEPIKYTITLVSRRTEEIVVEVVPSDPGDAKESDNGSAQLKRVLAKTIENKILDRANRPKVE
jgi:hypothetical protein